jgi:hypothetical protein
MALRLGSLKLPWVRKDSHADDPYWDRFIHTPPADAANLVSEMIRAAPEGNVFPTKADLHTPEITSAHVKEMARYLGADLVGIARAASENPEDGFPFAVLCALQADHDPRKAAGVGGQVPVQNGLFVTFVLSAWIRELGFRATAKPDSEAERLAARAGLGTIDSEGRLVTPEFGSRIYVADPVRTDLPLITDV